MQEQRDKAREAKKAEKKGNAINFSGWVLIQASMLEAIAANKQKKRDEEEAKKAQKSEATRKKKEKEIEEKEKQAEREQKRLEKEVE